MPLYNENTIQSLIDLVGWSEAVQPSEIAVTSQNVTATSGRYFSSFHQTAIVENVDATLVNPDKTNETLNTLLYKMKRDTVLEVLNRIYDSNPLAYQSQQQLDGRIVTSINFAAEYDLLTANRISVFSDVIGYNMACRCLQLFATSTRSNRLQKIQEMNYEAIKVELEGVFGQDGKMIAKGAFYRYEQALKRAIEILFPTTTRTLNTLKGVHPW